jgi:predicted esterase
MITFTKFKLYSNRHHLANLSRPWHFMEAALVKNHTAVAVAVAIIVAAVLAVCATVRLLQDKRSIANQLTASLRMSRSVRLSLAFTRSLVCMLIFKSSFITKSPLFTRAMSTSSKDAALVFLHGLGDTPSGWSSLEYTLPRLAPQLDKLVYVFPPAPVVAISINGGMRMPGWFDLYDWPISVGVQDDPNGIQRGVAQVNQAIDEVVAKYSIPRSRIIVGGFSQGGAIALRLAYDNKLSASNESLAGCVSLSGWLTEPEAVKWANTQTPCFWGHGKFDDKVLFEQQAFGVDKMNKAGITCTVKQYRMGHESDPQEIADLAAFITKILYSNEAPSMGPADLSKGSSADL